MQWLNEAGRAAANRYFTNGAKAVDRYGEAIWDYMCFLSAQGEEFRTHDLVAWLADEAKLANRTAYNYVMAFLGYCRAANEDFSGPASRLEQKRRSVWVLADNPER
jgi:hypothetical protein